MPATSLTKVTAASFADGIADVGYEAADQPNGNDFVNTGSTVLLVKNASGGNVNVTFTGVGPSKYTINDSLTKTPAGPVANGDTAFYGPFPTAIYGNTVTVAYDVGTSVTVAVVDMAPTPI